MQKKRLIALDLLRGITILMMVIVNNPGNWDTVYPVLTHAKWNGCKLADFVFPFFIVIMGMAIPLAITSKENLNLIYTKIFVRSLRIISLGLFLNFFNKISIGEVTGISLVLIKLILTIIIGYALMGNYNTKLKLYLALLIIGSFLLLAFTTSAYQEVRLLGVLQRIGIVYFITAVLFLTVSHRIQIVILILLLLGYWAIMALIPFPGIEIANFEKGTNIAAWIDQIILRNHVYVGTKIWDPEGILSTMPAIAQGMIGCLMGQLFLISFSTIQILKKLTYYGLGFIALGLLWSIHFPINKSIWSSSFVLYTSGTSILIFVILSYLVDYKNYKKGINPILVWGVNPMIVFFLSGIIPRTLSGIFLEHPQNSIGTITLQRYIYQYGIEPYFSNPLNASLAYTFLFISILHFILFLLFKNKIIIKV